MPVEEFPRMKRLPPYVFATVNALKMEARRRGEDIIDLGMGNPDLATPPHIVAKLIEAAGKGTNHRYSASQGHHQAQGRHLGLVQAPLRRGYRPGDRGHRHHRRQGGPVPPGAGHGHARGRGAGAQPHLPHPFGLRGDFRGAAGEHSPRPTTGIFSRTWCASPS